MVKQDRLYGCGCKGNSTTTTTTTTTTVQKPASNVAPAETVPTVQTTTNPAVYV